jgi:hypothetical protein
MLTVPAYTQLDGIPIFKDDDPERRGDFYYLARQPTLVTAPNGKAVFDFLRFQIPPERSDQLGGGYLTCQVKLTEPPDVIEGLKPRLAQLLRAEFPNELNLPPVTLSPIDYIAGDVRVLVIDNANLVRSVATTRASLFADNTASVAITLPELGAQLFYDALKQGGSVGILEYNLTFEVRLSAIQVKAHLDSRELRKVVATYTVEHVEDEDTWGNSTKTEQAHRTSLAEHLESQGLVHIEVLKGSTDVPTEEVESLRAFAFSAVDDHLKQHFLKGGPAVTAEDLKSQWLTFIGEDVVSDFDLDVSYRSVIKRFYFPSAVINPDFIGAPVDSVVKDIDLRTAPWYFNNLDVTVDTNLDFDKYGDIIHSVVGHLSYEETKPDGTRIAKRDSLLFTKNDRAPKHFKTPLAEVGRDTFDYEVEVHYKAGPVQSAVLRRDQSNKRDLVLDVPNPGVLEIDLSSDPAVFESGQLSSIEVEIEYGDGRNRVPTVTDTVMLRKDNPEASYSRPVYAPVEQPYRLRSTYVYTDEAGATQRITTAWEPRRDRNVSIHTPFDSQFNLTILAQADWRELAQIVTDMEYADREHDYSVRKTLSFSEASVQSSPVSTWTFPLRDPDKRSYRYREVWLRANASRVEKPWRTVDSDASTLLVGNAPGGVVTIEVDPTDVGIGDGVRRAAVRFRYADPPHNVLDTQSMVFRDNTPQTWTIARADESVDTYTYDVTYTMDDNTTRRLADQQGTIGGDTEFLFLQPPPAS